jgi:hypothetical protein
MKGRCFRWSDCRLLRKIGCSGCGFQHFAKILEGNKSNKLLKALGNKYFHLCSKQRKGTGGRISLDKPIKELFMEKIPELKELSSLRETLIINQEDIVFEIKCDGGFEYKGKYIFYEIKGYGDNTNDILSAITAAQLSKEIPKYKDSLYYYIGISSGERDYKGGLKRNAFLDEKRIKVGPYVKWAENKGLLKFYGIVDIVELLEEIKNVT